MVLQKLFPVLFFFFSIAAWSGAADLSVVHFQTEPQENAAIDISISAPANDQQLKTAVAWARKSMAAAAAENSALKTEVLVVGTEEGEVAPNVLRFSDLERAANLVVKDTGTKVSTQTLPSAMLAAEKPEFKSWFSRHYRVSFTLIRGILNATTVTLSLVISSDIPIERALPVGLVAGAMSAGFQYYNSGFQAWLNRGKTRTERFGRWFGIEVVYLSVAKATSAAAGIIRDASFEMGVVSIFKTALVSLLAQGPWDISVAEQHELAVKRAPELQSRIRLLTDLKTLAISTLSVAAAVAKLMQIPFSDIALWGIGSTGAVNFVWTYYKSQKYKRDLAAASKVDCARLLTRP